MSCERIKLQITWYLYNELDEMARAAVEDHVEHCLSCAAEMDRERAFLNRLHERPALESSAALLAECRHDLMRAVYRDVRLGRERADERPFSWRSLRVTWLSMRVWWQPMVAACLLALGFFSGWWTRHGGRPIAGPLNPNEAAIAGISGVTLDPAARTVQISFDELRRQTLTGSLQDPDIQKLLIFAARSYGNPGVRLDTIDILKERAGDRQIRDTLLYLVANDGNPGVRLKALEALKQSAREAPVRQALIRVLTNDDNSGMRVQAIDLLAAAQDRSLVGILQGVAQKEENNYVRMRCQDALRDMNASVETF